MDLEDELKNILQTVVTNKNLITPEVVSEALRDMTEIVKEKELETPFMLDIAIYRFFVRVNAKAPESVTNSYKEALERLKIVPLKETKSALAVVGQRSSVWI
ncbi:hypothetical protein [Hydrogenimonas thermophila]|uniref:Bacteriocin immunity protein n=1 Tax=Hydrogenimonas thermophila TaxID=223786 RepID=A0A1I5RQ72_9BACT|nr:hypothetical protein [Hydrogenimonas thermophila]SFP60692.1 hypothetical protein SAMN05216234_12817 [Hydrogenimonas thermophila]